MRRLIIGLAIAVLVVFLPSGLTLAEDPVYDTERLELHSGGNLVRWLGSDGVSPAEILDGLDKDQVFGILLRKADDQAWTAFHTPAFPGATAVSSVNYGDYLGLYLFDDQSWDRPIRPPGELHFSPELTKADRERVTSDVRAFEQLLADRFGVQQDPYTLYVAEDWRDMHALMIEHGQVPYFPPDTPSGGCPGAPELILVNRSCYDGLSPGPGYAVASAALSSARLSQPLDYHLSHGFMTYATFASYGSEQEAVAVAGKLAESRSITAPIALIHDLDPRIDTRPLQLLATIYLAEAFGDESLIRFFENLSTGGDTATALEYAFGLSLEEFHRNVESYREVVAPPISVGEDHVILLGQEAQKHGSEIRRIVASIEQWFNDVFGYSPGNTVWKVDSNWRDCGLALRAVVQIGENCLLTADVYAHEYFHVLQLDRSTPPGSGIARSYPPFIMEGSAMFVDSTYEASLSGKTWSDIRAGIVAEATRYDIALDDPALENSHGVPEYILGALATEWLETYSGGKSVADYYHALSQQELRSEDGLAAQQFAEAGERAFRAFWGISSDEFYGHFACWRSRGYPLAEVGEECVSP